MTELLILSGSAGNGHVRAAQAIEAAARSLPGELEIVHLDATQHVASGFRKVYSDWYMKLASRHPAFWSHVHQKTDETPHNATSQRLRRAVERMSSGSLMRVIRAERPDTVVCTHFLPAELLMRDLARDRIDVPVGCRSPTTTCTTCGWCPAWRATSRRPKKWHTGCGRAGFLQIAST